MAKIVKEWNGTVIEFRNGITRAELAIDGRTLDCVDAAFLKEGKNDLLQGQNVNGDKIQVKVTRNAVLGVKLLTYSFTAIFYFNGRKVYSESFIF